MGSFDLDRLAGHSDNFIPLQPRQKPVVGIVFLVGLVLIVGSLGFARYVSAPHPVPSAGDPVINWPWH